MLQSKSWTGLPQYNTVEKMNGTFLKYVDLLEILIGLWHDPVEGASMEWPMSCAHVIRPDDFRTVKDSASTYFRNLTWDMMKEIRYPIKY